MQARRVDVAEVVARYAAGFFPLVDPWDRFYWERLSVRAMIPMTHETADRARRLARRGGKRFEIRRTTAVNEIVTLLRDEKIKPRSWVREDVVAIYGALFSAGLLRTVEAWRDGRLVGGLVGIVMPGTFIAETMFGLEPEASKICLCQLVEDCAMAGIEIIDVQTPHDRDEFGDLRTDGRTPHPCLRLGEISVPLATFMQLFRAAWKRAFAGGVTEWIQVAGANRV